MCDLRGMRGCAPRVIFLGGGGSGDRTELAGASEVDATSLLSPGATEALRVRVPLPRPRVLRSPPALAATVTCHRVPLSPPRLTEMAGDGAAAASCPQRRELSPRPRLLGVAPKGAPRCHLCHQR